MIDERTKALYKDKFEKIKDLKVAVIGLGGVGSIVPIALARSGVKKFLLIDKDEVVFSNLNRQLAYFEKDVGKKKAYQMKENLLMIRKDLDIEVLAENIDENFNFDVFSEYEYILDCIDDINAKILLLNYAKNNSKKIIVSLGMGKRYKASEVMITNLEKTFNCPLAKKYRYLVRKENINPKDVLVAFSKEEVKEFDNSVIASSFFVPNEAGLLIANYVLNDFLEIK